MALPAKNRLPNAALFRSVMRRGNKARSAHLVIYAVMGQTSKCGVRVGVLVSKKTAKKATERNAIKRKISAVLYERILTRMVYGGDVVVHALPGSGEMGYSEFCGELEVLFHKLNLL